MSGKQILFAIIAAFASLDRSEAQEVGDARAGFAVAERLCSECHAVEKGKLESANEESPSFEAIASVPGMNAIALTAALNTSHRNMPNVILTPDEQADIIAYILSIR